MTASPYNSQTISSTDKQRTPKQSASSEPSDQNTKLLALAEQVAHFGSWEWDVSKPRAVWSPEMFRIFGINPDVEGLTLQEYRSFIHPDDLDQITKRMEASMLNVHLNQESKIDYRIIRRDGSVRVIHSQRQVRAVTPDGHLKVIVGVDQDVTEQKAAEEALKKSEERFRIVAEAANVMVYEIEVETRKIHFIKGASHLIGYEPREVGPTLDWVIERIHPDDIEHVRSTWNQVKDNPNIDKYAVEYRFRHKNGTYIIVKDTAKAVKDSQGKTISFIGGIRDITQRRIDKEKIEQYSKGLEELVEERTKQLIAYERFAAIGQVAGMVGHDIRNPLQALTSEVYLLKSDLSEFPQSELHKDMEDSLSSIEHNIGYINKIIADLQDYSRQLTPEYTTVDFKDLISHVFETISVPSEIQLSFDIKSLSKLRCDPTFIRRALTNLINNAIQAMPNGGKLKIAGYHQEGNAYITVADTGMGISDEVKTKLFTPMFTTKTKGQGLGLAVVKRLVEAQGGSIWFDSQLGRGTKFFIKLPYTALI